MDKENKLDMGPFALDVMKQKYLFKEKKEEKWEDVARRVTKHVLRSVGIMMSDPIAKKVCKAITERKFIPGGRYLYASGRPLHQVQNCLLLKAEDSREGWADIWWKSGMALMTGAGIGIDYSGIRGEGKPIRKTGGFATGPIALMKSVNEQGRYVMQGGSRRSAIWAGLSWSHPDILKFIHVKDWSDTIRKAKQEDFSFPAPMDMTNISVILDDDFFEAYQNEKDPLHAHARSVYWDAMEQMLRTSEPGFSVNVGKDRRETLRNACTEITSEDDSDICNLGSVNMARISNHEEMEEIVELATLFLLAGTVYSDVPYARVDQVRTKNRRIGLGLMGLHEWLLMRGKKYGPDDELEEYLKIYANNDKIARKWAKKLELSEPLKTRAIAPTGTIGILAETTTGIEPIFCAAYKRRYLKHNTWNYQYVIDPISKRLVEMGVDPERIEDAYSIDFERRVAFQAWVQEYVDHSISSTINLPKWGSATNNSKTVQEYGKILMKYLPQLRGITCYADGSRGGQPLTPVKYTTAMKHEGQVFEEASDICDISKGGTCGE